MIPRGPETCPRSHSSCCVCTRVLGLQALLPQTPGALSAPAGLRTPSGACPPRPLDGSLGLRRAARAAGGSAGAAAALGTGWLEASRATPREALQLVPKPGVAGSMRPKEKSCWKQSRLAVPELERGLGPGSPSAGSEGPGSARGWRALPALGTPRAMRVQGRLGRVGEAKRGEIRDGRPPGLTRSGPLRRGLRLRLTPSVSSRLACDEPSTSSAVSWGQFRGPLSHSEGPPELKAYHGRWGHPHPLPHGPAIGERRPFV